MSFLESKIPPPFVALLLAWAMRAASSATPTIPMSPAVRVYGALAIGAVGLLVEIAGIVSFARARTTADPIHPRAACRLVTSGVYRFTRNPMYLGDLLMLIAWALYLASPVALVLTPLFVAYIDRFQIRAEERAMVTLFGVRYREYAARVRRWA